MNLSTMLADLYRRLNYATTPATEVSTRLTAFVNASLQELMSEAGVGAWLTRNEPPVTFDTVVGQAVYASPVARIDAISDRSNRERLTLQSMDWYRRVDPDPTAHTGRPESWVPLGFSAVATPPVPSDPQATGLWAVSTSASDTAIVVRLDTVRTGGVTFSGSATLTGTSRVQISSLTDHTQVAKFSLSAAAVGAVSLYTMSSGGTALATIAIGQTFSRYQALALWPTPSSVLTYTVDSERELADLSSATDEPPLPARFHRVLIDGALQREYEKREQPELSELARRRYEQGVRDWRYFVTCPPDYLPVLGRSRVERSRLGGNYPDGSGIW